MRPDSGESHLGWSRNLARRVRRLLGTFSGKIRAVDCWPAYSRLDRALLSYALTREEFPSDYVTRLRIRLPLFVALTSSAYPELSIFGNWKRVPGAVFGPFPARAHAAQWIESVLPLFQIRRCTGELSPSAEHPGCVYGEMNQCLRPCQQAVSQPEYLAEAERVEHFLQTGGESLSRNLEQARDSASANLDFEAAAHIHKRLERVRESIAASEDYMRDVRTFSGLALTPAAPGFCSLRPMIDAVWHEPLLVDLRPETAGRRSLDAELRERLAIATAEPRSASEREKREHLAIFSRWFRSSFRDGEWFPLNTSAAVDYRSLVRRISRLKTC